MLSISSMMDWTLSVGTPLIGYQCTSAQSMSAASACRIVLFQFCQSSTPEPGASAPSIA